MIPNAPEVYVRPTPKRRYIHIGYKCPACREAVDLRTTDPEGVWASRVVEMAREHPQRCGLESSG